MGEIASRKLRNDTRGLLRRVEAGEDVVITVDGRQVAILRPVGHRPRWLSRGDFMRRFSDRQADPGLAEDLLELAPSGGSFVNVMPSAGGGDRDDNSMGTHGRPLPPLWHWPPLAVQLGQQAEMGPLQGQVDISFGRPSLSETWVSLAVAVHNRYVGTGSLPAISAS